MKHRKLRRMAILSLVLVLAFNTLGAKAGTTSISVSTYEELMIALEQAENLDTITVTSFLVIPMGSSLGDSSKQVIIKFADAGYLEFELDNTYSNPSAVTNLIIDGDGKKSLAPMLRARGKVDFINCEFKRANEGAVYAGHADISFTDCTFFSNSGTYGGHMNLGYYTTATFDNCSFSYGTSTVRGGGIYAEGNTCYATFRNCIITANESVYGGGIYNAGNLVLESTLFYNNYASTGGDDLCNATGSYDLGSLGEMWQAFRDSGITIKPLEWEQSVEEYSGWEYYKLLYTADIPEEPTEPTTPTEETEEPTSLEPEEPTTPAEEQPTDPTTGDNEGETGGDNSGEGEDQPSGDGGDIPTTPDDGGESETTPPPSEEDNKPENPSSPTSTSSDADKEDISGGDTNSTTNSTTDNSQSNNSSSMADNSSHESNDNSSYREDNSYRDSSSTVNNYYQQESPKQEPTAAQNGSQPINITAPAEVSTSQEKAAPTGSTELTEGAATSSPQQNIKIEAEGVDLIYEYSENGVSISIKAPESPKEEEVDSVVSTSMLPETPQEADKSPNRVEYVSMLLLAVLVGLEIKGKIKPHREG